MYLWHGHLFKEVLALNYFSFFVHTKVDWLIMSLFVFVVVVVVHNAHKTKEGEAVYKRNYNGNLVLSRDVLIFSCSTTSRPVL